MLVWSAQEDTLSDSVLGLQVQQQEQDTWQAFCAASVRVVPSEAATAAIAGMQEGLQGNQELYQHRLPQLADRMRRLLSEAGLTIHHAQGVASYNKAWQLFASSSCCCNTCPDPMTAAVAHDPQCSSAAWWHCQLWV